MRRLSAALSVIALVTVAACFTTSVGVGAAAAPFLCPKDATTTDTQKWVKNFDGYRGSVWCDDGATAIVRVSVGPSPLIFKGGVCTSATTGTFISIGVVISKNQLKATDPPGFKTLKWNKKTSTPEAAAFSRTGKFYWSDEVKIAWNGLTGSWSGSDGQWIANKYTDVKASAKFTCKRIVKTGF
jgi:hypothetical protein